MAPVGPPLGPVGPQLGHNTPLGHHTDHRPTGLGQYDSLGEYYGPHTASSVFLILLGSGEISDLALDHGLVFVTAQ